jgi:hypothetical protein
MSAQVSGQQYLRNCSVIVANKLGEGMELGALRVTFQVRRGDIETPNTADVTIWNLSRNTANTLRNGQAPEFTRLRLQVSYGTDPLATVFQGSIKQIRLGREDQRNSYLTITAADSDAAYNFAPLALSLAAGHTPTARVQSVLKAMASVAVYGSPTGGPGGQGVVQGYMPKLTENRSFRGMILAGLCKHEMRQIAKDLDCKWSLQDGALTLIRYTAPIPSAPDFIITPQTGLIGVPEQTQNGMEVRILLNAAIKIGHVIKLDQSSINEIRFDPSRAAQSSNRNLAASQAKINGDGLYYVMRADHTGDTRGNPWYTDLVCLAVDASAPQNPLSGTQGIQFAGSIKRF